MPAVAKAKMVAMVRKFVNSSFSCRHPLVEWQQLLGWINFLHLALQSSYAKILGKSCPHTTIYLNCAVIKDLLWLADTVECSDGVYMMDAVEWDVEDANATVYCDASLTGMGFYCPSLNVSYCSPVPENSPLHTIFYYEALCVVSALLWAS